MGAAGNKLPDSPVGESRCGTHLTTWISGSSLENPPDIQYVDVNIRHQYAAFVPQTIILINYSRSASSPAGDRCTMNGKYPRINIKRTKATHKQKNIAS